MSRAGAGLGSAIGTVAGGMLGITVGGYIPPQPGYTPADDKALLYAVEAIGAIIGAVVGAVVGAGPDTPPPPARFQGGLSGVNHVRFP